MDDVYKQSESLSNNTVEQKPSQIKKELNLLANEIERAEVLQNKIHTRISGILQQVPPNADMQEDEKVGECLVPLADEIHVLVCRLQHIADVYDTMLSRIEL